MWLVIRGRDSLLLQMEIRLWECKRWMSGLFLFERCCCLGLKCLSWIEQSVLVTVLCKTKAKHLSTWRNVQQSTRYVAGGNCSTKQQPMLRTNNKIDHHLLNSRQHGHCRNIVDWKLIQTIFDLTSKTFISDISFSDLPHPCHHIYVCH